MTISLSTFYADQKNYIEALNSDNGIVESNLNILTTDLNALKGAVGPGSDMDFRLNAFNLLLNGGFDYWQRGASTRPDCWNIESAGAGFAVAKSIEKTLNTYSVKLTNTGSLTQSLDDYLRVSLEPPFVVTFGVWVKTDQANSARIGVWN